MATSDSGQTVSDNSQTRSSSDFDPYHKWLGIAKDERPPHYYQLLGIPLYESDADVIDSAASQRMAYVRQCATGPQAAASQQVLNDLSEAQICLLNPDKKADYDARLKVKLRNSSKNSSEAGTSGAANTDAKVQQRLRTLDKQKKQAETLLKKGEFAAAIDILEKMAAVKSPKLAKYAKWAKQQLPAARRGPKEMQESTAAIHRTAQGLFDRNDFEEAAEILQQIPRKFRGPETEALLQECLDIQEEIVVLQEDIDHAESLKKYGDLLPTVERLLELKPNDRRAKQLRKELKTYGKGGGMRLGGRGDTRFDAAGNTSSPIKLALLVLVPLAAFGGVSWYAYDYLSSLQQTIQIEIDDPTATVVIDDKTIEVTGEGDTAKLKPGLHQLRVERDGDVLLTRQFDVVKGKNPILEISVADIGQPPSTATTTPAPESPPEPPITYSKTVREAAEWVLSAGGKVTVAGQIIAEPAQLPSGDFQVSAVGLERLKVTDRELPHLLPLRDLTVLSLIDTEVGDGSVPVMTQFPQLRGLMLDHTNVTATGLAELAKQPLLTTYFLYDVGLTDDNLQFVTAHTNLTSLTVAGNALTDQSVVGLVELKKLHTLQVQATRIGDAGVREFAKLPELKILYMGSVNITNADLGEFLNYPKLERLRFYVASIDDGGIDDLIKLQNLKELYLVKTKVTEAGANRLKAAMPNTQVVYEK